MPCRPVISVLCSRQPPAELQYFPANLPHNKRPFYPQQTYNHKKWKLIKTILSRSHHNHHFTQVKWTFRSRIKSHLPGFSVASGGLFLIRLHNVSRCWTVSHQGVWAITDWDCRHTQWSHPTIRHTGNNSDHVMGTLHTTTSLLGGRGGGDTFGHIIFRNCGTHCALC